MQGHDLLAAQLRGLELSKGQKLTLHLHVFPWAINHIAHESSVFRPLKGLINTTFGDWPYRRISCMHEIVINYWWRKCKNREDWRAIVQVLLDIPSP